MSISCPISWCIAVLQTNRDRPGRARSWRSHTQFAKVDPEKRILNKDELVGRCPWENLAIFRMISMKRTAFLLSIVRIMMITRDITQIVMNFIFHCTNKKKRIVRMDCETSLPSTIHHVYYLTRLEHAAFVCKTLCVLLHRWSPRKLYSIDLSEFRRRWTWVHSLTYAYISVFSLERENYCRFCQTMFELERMCSKLTDGSRSLLDD